MNAVEIRRSPTMKVVSCVIVFYVVFCVKKYMSSFQMCDRIADTDFVDPGFHISTHTKLGNVYSFYVSYDVQYEIPCSSCEGKGGVLVLMTGRLMPVACGRDRVFTQ